jgi:ABC-type dipeptide/oligopeptide/nickel transport system permease component
MIFFAARRLGWALFTALIASIAAFAMFWAIPNVDPEYWLGGAEKGTDATYARAVEQYGLDDPLPVQYTRLMESVLKRVIRRHVLRNGLIPPVNLWGLDFSHAFGGFALYVELIFDLPPIVAMTIYLTIVVVLVSALVDLVIAALDPRIRRSGTLV